MTGGPATRRSLVEALGALGLPGDRPTLVHASMRQVGPVDGGAATLLSALRTVVGRRAAVVVPAQTPDNSTTSPVFRAATAGLAPAEIARYVAGLSGFDRATTPSHGMGVFAEHVRRHPAAVRSAHPQTSFAAIGGDAARLMRGHRLESHLGEQSPLAALYAADATVLLLGVGFASCTAFHLAEYRLPAPRRQAYRCFVRENGARRQVDFEGLKLDDSDFAELGAALELHAGATVHSGIVGAAVARALPMRPSVDFAVDWLGRHRSTLAPARGITYGDVVVAHGR
jgi:aminoglycoside 3-N-acetyltransferase